MREQSSVMVTKLKPFSYIICIIVELFLIYRNGLHAFKRKQHHVYCLLFLKLLLSLIYKSPFSHNFFHTLRNQIFSAFFINFTNVNDHLSKDKNK